MLGQIVIRAAHHVLALLLCAPLFTTPAHADTITIQLQQLEPVTPSSGDRDAWCNLRFKIENNTDWLMRHVNIGVSSLALTGERRRHAYLDLRQVPVAGEGIYVSETVRSCDEFVGAFTLDAPRAHLGYNCAVVNHTAAQCHDLIRFEDARRQINGNQSTAQALASIAKCDFATPGVGGGVGVVQLGS